MIKRIVKWAILNWRFRTRNVEIDKTCRLAAGSVECEGNNKIYAGASFRGKLGFGSYVGQRSSLNAVIGRYCSIACDVKTISGSHPTRDFVSTHPAFFSVMKQAGFSYVSQNSYEENQFVDDDRHLVEIGNDVWIGSDVILLPGIHIGDGAIIAAGAVVCRDVSPYSIVGGVPAKEIRKRFTEDQISRLLEIKWWNRDESWLKQHVKLFEDIYCFLEEEGME